MKKLYEKNSLIKSINKIREEINHDKVDIHIKEIILKENKMWIICEDKVDKSAIIGKGGWVVGLLKEELKLDKIHVESYEDFILKKYRLELSLKYLKKYIKENKIENLPLNNLEELLEYKTENIYTFNIKEYMENNNFKETKESNVLVALSGGADSSFSLILSKFLGFNPIAISIDPGTIILPKQFKNNIDNLTKELNVSHYYIPTDNSNIIEESLNGKIHPCGRCSKSIESEVNNYAIKNNIPFVIYGDLISTGSQSIKSNENITRLNLPAILLTQKQEIKSLIKEYNIEKIDGFGCPLLYEVHKKYPYMKKFSIQRILRETRSSALESGEALDLIWSCYK